jgi:cell division protein FtsI (penicillin-binding protein 3)
MTPEPARAVIATLDEVVNGARGTGSRARVAGARVAGKTGTSAWDRPAGGEGRYASFVGIVPEDAPRFVILVGVEQPKDEGAGGDVAAPAFARIAARALEGR